VAKLIRTAEVKGPAVTIGQLERDAYVGSLGGSSDGGVDSLDIEILLIEEGRKTKEIADDIWQEKLDREIKAVRTGLEDRHSEIEEKWRQEKEEIYAQRYDEGLNEGLAQRESEAKSAIDRFGDLRESLLVERRELLINSEATVIDLTMAIVRRIIGIESVENKKVLVNTVRAALSELSQYGNIEIRVHPEDLSIATRFSQHWVEKVDKDSVLNVRSSDHVDRGGCIIEGPVENIDARLEKQLDILHEALRESAIEEISDARDSTGDNIDE
jgi:flagellar biosynthesis/type III secretory pathway protein FliH